MRIDHRVNDQEQITQGTKYKARLSTETVQIINTSCACTPEMSKVSCDSYFSSVVYDLQMICIYDHGVIET